MYNHARTLLVNLDGSEGLYADVPGEESIPVEYKALNLPTYLDTVRSRIFGARPDRAMLNYRTSQLLKIIATTDLQEYVAELDSRLTYPTSNLIDFDFTPKITQFEGTGNSITLTGAPISPDVSGVSKFEFRVRVFNNNLEVDRLSWPRNEKVTALEITENLSQPVPLQFSGYSVRVVNTNDCAWMVRGYLKPSNNLTDLLASFSSIGSPVLLQLFGPSKVEPYTTFYNCWKNHPDFSYRLGGIVLALIYRSEEIRRGI